MNFPKVCKSCENAAAAALKQTESSGELAAEKMNAIESVLFKQRLTVQGAALKFNYSEFTVQRWLNDFINLVGVNAGYSDAKT